MNTILWNRQGGRRYPQWGGPTMTGVYWPSVGAATPPVPPPPPPPPPTIVLEGPRLIQTRITQNGDVPCKIGQGILDAVVVSTRGTPGNRLTLYDSLQPSGPILAIIDMSVRVGRIAYDVQVRAGVTASLNGGTPGDVLVITA